MVVTTLRRTSRTESKAFRDPLAWHGPSDQGHSCRIRQKLLALWSLQTKNKYLKLMMNCHLPRVTQKETRANSFKLSVVERLRGKKIFPLGHFSFCIIVTLLHEADNWSARGWDIRGYELSCVSMVFNRGYLTDGWTNEQTNERYQISYLPASLKLHGR